MKNQQDHLKERMSRITDSIEAVAKYSRLSKIMDSVESQGVFSNIAEKGVEAQLLLNFQRTVVDKITDSTDGATRGDQVNLMSDFGPYVPEVFPVIAAWYPEFPLKDLISVQDMSQDLAYLLFSKIITGTNKAPTLVGQVIETPLGQRKINGYYPTGVVIGEQIPGSHLSIENAKIVGAVVYYALKTSGDYLKKFKLTVDVDGTKTIYRAFAVVGDVIQLCLSTAPEQAVEGAVWDIESGGFYLPTQETDTSKINVVANYVWDLDYAVDENIPKVKEQVEKVEMRAEPRVLAMQWTIFAEALKKSQFSKDIRVENTTRVLDILYQYQVRYVLDEMYEDATGAESTITIPKAGIYDVGVAYNNVMNQLKGIATDIEYASGRMEGNRIVCGRDFKNWCESLPNTMFQPVAQPDGFSSPRKIGKLGTFEVYFDQRRGNDEAFMTYRGSEWYDAAYYMGVFLPMVPTDAIGINVTIRQAFASMEAYKYHKPSCVFPFKVAFGN